MSEAINSGEIIKSDSTERVIVIAGLLAAAELLVEGIKNQQDYQPAPEEVAEQKEMLLKEAAELGWNDINKAKQLIASERIAEIFSGFQELSALANVVGDDTALRLFRQAKGG